MGIPYLEKQSLYLNKVQAEWIELYTLPYNNSYNIVIILYVSTFCMYIGK